MAESKHVICSRIQCTLVAIRREIPFRQGEKYTVEQRLSALNMELSELSQEKRQLDQTNNVNLPPALRPNPAVIIEEFLFRIFILYRLQQVEERISTISNTIKKNEIVFSSIDHRLSNLGTNLRDSESEFNTHACGMNYASNIATPEDCNLLPLKPLDTIGDREFPHMEA